MYHVMLRTVQGTILETIETVYEEDAESNECGITGIRLVPCSGGDWVVSLPDNEAKTITYSIMQSLFRELSYDFTRYPAILMDSDNCEKVYDDEEVSFMMEEKSKTNEMLSFDLK